MLVAIIVLLQTESSCFYTTNSLPFVYICTLRSYAHTHFSVFAGFMPSLPLYIPKDEPRNQRKKEKQSCIIYSWCSVDLFLCIQMSSSLSSVSWAVLTQLPFFIWYCKLYRHLFHLLSHFQMLYSFAASTTVRVSFSLGKHTQTEPPKTAKKSTGKNREHLQ